MLTKPKEYNIADSNIANLGSELEKNVKKAAAETEHAWKGAGSKVGIEIWRIEKFKVIAWPKEQYGSFYDGDSYIILYTYKKEGSDALFCDLFFWLGKYTTQDEAGTAAYKTVELDDFLGGKATQHREVQGYESDFFLGLFKLGNEKGIRILSGGVDTGFKHVEGKKYKTRLLQLKGKKKIRITEVDLIPASLNSGDVFLLDKGELIIQWNGKKAGIFEKNRGSAMCRALTDERMGRSKSTVNEEGSEDAEFWPTLGCDKRPDKIKTAEEGGSDEEAEKTGEKRLFQLSDSTGKMVFTEVGVGTLKRTMLKSEDAFILDIGSEVFAWIGKGASPDEKKKALGYAQDYLTKYKRPAYLPITKILEGGENPVFEGAFVSYK